MIGRYAARLAAWLLKKTDLALPERNLLTASVLENLAALSLRDIIKVEDGILLIGGKPVDMELARVLRESARGALNNTAFKLIREQVMFEAMSTGTYTAKSDLDVYFGKASVWYGQREQAFLEILAGQNVESELDAN
ncbi:MAG: hypothetical protein V4438_04200 [Patescibacteria group bacterium]